MHGAVAVYFEAAAVITVLVLLGQVLELRARAQTSGAIRALLGRERPHDGIIGEEYGSVRTDAERDLVAGTTSRQGPDRTLVDAFADRPADDAIVGGTTVRGALLPMLSLRVLLAMPASGTASSGSLARTRPKPVSWS